LETVSVYITVGNSNYSFRDQKIGKAFLKEHKLLTWNEWCLLVEEAEFCRESMY